MNKIRPTFYVVNRYGELYRIAEGDGSNLDQCDIDSGFVDYIILEKKLLNDNEERINNHPYDDGAMILLTHPYDNFKTCEQCLKAIVKNGWLAESTYFILEDDSILD